MYRALVAVMLCSSSGCGDGDVVGEELVAYPRESTLSSQVLVRADDPPLSLDYHGTSYTLSIYDPGLEVWRELESFPLPAWLGHGDQDDYYLLRVDGLFHSTDGIAWTNVGPGLPAGARGAIVDLVIPRGRDGTRWFLSNNGQLYRSRAGDTAWTLENGGGKQLVAAPDGTLWTTSDQGISRMPVGATSFEPVYGCDAPELLYCSAGPYQIAFDNDGDLFFYLRNDVTKIQRFYERDAETGTVTERGRLAAYIDGSATSIAVVGDTLYAVELTGGPEKGLLQAFVPGSTTAKELAETAEPVNVTTSSDRKRLFVYNVGVFELR